MFIKVKKSEDAPSENTIMVEWYTYHRSNVNQGIKDGISVASSCFCDRTMWSTNTGKLIHVARDPVCIHHDALISVKKAIDIWMQSYDEHDETSFGMTIDEYLQHLGFYIYAP